MGEGSRNNKIQDPIKDGNIKADTFILIAKGKSIFSLPKCKTRGNICIYIGCVTNVDSQTIMERLSPTTMVHPEKQNGETKVQVISIHWWALAWNPIGTQFFRTWSLLLWRPWQFPRVVIKRRHKRENTYSFFFMGENTYSLEHQYKKITLMLMNPKELQSDEGPFLTRCLKRICSRRRIASYRRNMKEKMPTKIEVLTEKQVILVNGTKSEASPSNPNRLI